MAMLAQTVNWIDIGGWAMCALMLALAALILVRMARQHARRRRAPKQPFGEYNRPLVPDEPEQPAWSFDEKLDIVAEYNRRLDAGEPEQEVNDSILRRGKDRNQATLFLMALSDHRKGEILRRAQELERERQQRLQERFALRDRQRFKNQPTWRKVEQLREFKRALQQAAATTEAYKRMSEILHRRSRAS